MSDESRSFLNLLSNGQPDSNGFIKIDTTKLTSSSSLFNQNLHPNSSSYHASPFSQYLHQDSTDFGSVGGLVQNLQGRLNTWVQTSPTVLGFSQELVRSGNIADEYRLQALEAGEHILEEVQKDAVQILEKTSAIVSKKAHEFVIAHPELAGQVDELKHQMAEATDQVTEDVSKTLKAVGLKAFSMVFNGLRVAYDRSDQMTTEFPGRWKLFAGEMAERTLQVREAVQDAASKAAVSLRDQSTSTQVSPGGAIVDPTAYSATSSTLPIGSGDSNIHAIGFEGNVIAEAGAIVRSGAGRSFQSTAERYGFQAKVRFDAWKTGEMVDYSQELRTKSDRWYRIEGTNSWVSGAIVHTNSNLDNQAKVSPDAMPKVAEEKPFMGRIIATQANVRSGAGSQFEDVGDRFYGDLVEFGGQVKGELVDYGSTLGTSSDKWFRIKGTNQLISAALVTTDMGEPDGIPTPSPSGAGAGIKPNLDLPAYKEDNPFVKAGYGPPNCTWYANGRLKELGYDANIVDKMLGNAHEWDEQAIAAGLTISNEPKVGMIAVWEGGHGGSSEMGHVAIVEQVNADGSIVISESNWNSRLYSKRTIHPKSSRWADHFISQEKSSINPPDIQGNNSAKNGQEINPLDKPSASKVNIPVESKKFPDNKSLGLTAITGDNTKAGLIQEILKIIQDEKYAVFKLPETIFTTKKLFDVAKNPDEFMGKRQDINYSEYLDMKLKLKAQDDLHEKLVKEFVDGDLGKYREQLKQDTEFGGDRLENEISNKIQEYINKRNQLTRMEIENDDNSSFFGLLNLNKLNPFNPTFSNRATHALSETLLSMDEFLFGITKNGFKLATSFIPGLNTFKEVFFDLVEKSRGTYLASLPVQYVAFIFSIREPMDDLTASFPKLVQSLQDMSSDEIGKNFKAVLDASSKVGKELVKFLGSDDIKKIRGSEIAALLSAANALTEIASVQENPQVLQALDNSDRFYLAATQISSCLEALGGFSNLTLSELKTRNVNVGSLSKDLDKLDSVRGVLYDGFDFVYKQDSARAYDKMRSRFQSHQNLFQSLVDTVNFSAQKTGEYLLKVNGESLVKKTDGSIEVKSKSPVN